MTVVANVVGARPQFVKAGPVSRALEQAGVEELLVHTGQHYDELLSELVMRDARLRDPDIHLGVGSGSHARQTAQMMELLEEVLIERRPNAVVTYGDTNSTIAAALAAVKLGVPTAHVEAGLRSFNRRMPEEVNRVVTDRVSDLLFSPTRLATENLAAEGLADRTVESGDVMVDALHSIDFNAVDLPDWARGDFYVATIHRAGNTDDPVRLRSIVAALQDLDLDVHLLVHPRLASRFESFGIAAEARSLHTHPPLPYAQMLAVVRACRGLFTDSGGLQKEAFILAVRCVTLRPETEWPETLEGGWNALAEPEANLTVLARRDVTAQRSQPFGDGRAAENVVHGVLDRLVNRRLD